jgi:DNA mismatch endonuclease, patch repair protein
VRKDGELPYPEPTSEGVSLRMRRNLKTESKPERRIRSVLHRQGFRFRKHHPIRTPERLVKPDIVFTRARLAIFVDGCFWHCCPVHGNEPRANTDYWGPKLKRNVDRDRAVDRALTEAGWIVLRAWEHEDPDAVVTRIRGALAEARPQAAAARVAPVSRR